LTVETYSHDPAEDFLDEIRIAPAWGLGNDPSDGSFLLYVHYGFGVWACKSPSMKRMSVREAGKFYKSMTDVMNEPSVKEARLYLWSD
jgi:hypothetical protein